MHVLVVSNWCLVPNFIPVGRTVHFVLGAAAAELALAVEELAPD